MSRKGRLIIIGGAEEKDGHKRTILEEVAKAARAKPVVLLTVATQEPEETAKTYTKVFQELGLRKVRVLDIREREDALERKNVKLIEDAGVVFMTGGDQLRITSQIGDSDVFQTMQQLFKEGGTIAGTSAGAAAMSETMILSGNSDESSEISSLGLAPGLGFVSDLVIDSHFAERGRIGRLLGAVTQNPKNLGIGIDEDTAIVLENHHFRVIGSGAVYVVDGTEISYSSLSEKTPEGILTIHNAKLHVLGDGDRFDVAKKEPLIPAYASK
ncbi:MAG TPA: cyanophycinase [Planctomycetota bacterium]|nr:cyanophycinase [Planctomycetota bacterium]